MELRSRDCAGHSKVLNGCSKNYLRFMYRSIIMLKNDFIKIEVP
jgi:hypothetical protein